MSLCGCGDRCTCSVVGCNGITITGSGDAIDPYVICAPPETVFAAQNLDGSITIAPGGAYGHTPTISVSISPNAGNLLENDGAGLFVGTASAVSAVLPSGMMVEYAGSIVPSGWLLCNGQSLLVSSYPDLFGSIGYTYGGAGANFSLPDVRGRGTVHVGTHADVNALNDSDGLATASRTPKHVHSGPSHTHNVLANSIASNGSNTNVPNTGSVSSTSPPLSAGIEANFNEGTQAYSPDLANTSHTHNTTVGGIVVSAIGPPADVATSSAGTGNTGNSFAGYIVVNKIIKV